MDITLIFFGFLTAIACVGYFCYHRWFATDDPTSDLKKSDWEIATGPWVDYREYETIMAALFMLTIVLLVLGVFVS